MDGIMKGRKILKTISGVVAPLILEGMATSKRFNNCCYCHLSLQMIADELEISNDTVQTIVIENLESGGGSLLVL